MLSASLTKWGAGILRGGYMLWHEVVSRNLKINVCTSLQIWNHILHLQIYMWDSVQQKEEMSLHHSHPDPLRGHPSRRWATSYYQCIQTSKQPYRSICPRDVWASHAPTPPHQHAITPLIVWSYIDRSVSPVIFGRLINGASMFAWEHVVLL